MNSKNEEYFTHIFVGPYSTALFTTGRRGYYVQTEGFFGLSDEEILARMDAMREHYETCLAVVESEIAASITRGYYG